MAEQDARKPGHLHVRNWVKFQHYKDRTPPWIKLHRDILSDYEFSCLQDDSKLLLILLWVLASQLDNNIPPDPEWIRKQIDVDGPVDLKPLIDGGFVTGDSNALSLCKQSAIGETETEAYKEETYSKEKETTLVKKPKSKTKKDSRFEEWYQQYPKHVNKQAALKKWITGGCDEIADVIIAGTLRQIADREQWQDKKYIPGPDKFLFQKLWEDTGYATIEDSNHANSNRTAAGRRSAASERVKQQLINPDPDDIPF